MKLKVALIFFISSCLLGCSHQKSYPPVVYPNDYNAQIDVIYKMVNDWKGYIDIYTNLNTTAPTPVVLNIHGGGWYSGTNVSQTNFDVFFKKGYAVANVAYRLVDTAPAPAAIQDVRCALFYLINNAQELNIDTSKIVIMGTSAGGHLALMTGLLGDNNLFDDDCSTKNPFQITGIIDIYGITDLVPYNELTSAKLWLGDRYTDTDFVKSVSPVNYVSKNSPPVFIAHGLADKIVPYSQSIKLDEALKANSIETSFYTIPNAGHGRLSKKQKANLNAEIARFLNQLKPSSNN